MSTFLPSEKGMTIRFPSTANFLIDSFDRDDRYPSAADFQIVSTNSLVNGFFTRLAPVEVILDWCIDNIAAYWGNNTLQINDGTTTYTLTLADGQYTVQQALDALVVAATAAVTGTTFSVGGATGASGAKTIEATKAVTFLPGSLQAQLNIAANASGLSFPINCPNLAPTTFIDFVSQQLTYNQDLKDSTTSPIKRDVLFRWYFAWDGPAPVDTYGYPINQGYQRFVQRRAIAFPKQIRWDTLQPVGNVSFQVYDSAGNPLRPEIAAGEFEWKMSLLVSEC